MASLGPQPPEHLRVGCVHARTPCRARIAKPAESAEAWLALPPPSAHDPEESARDSPRRTPSQRRATPCLPVRSVLSKTCESNSDGSVRRPPPIGADNPPHPPRRRRPASCRPPPNPPHRPSHDPH